MDVSFDLDTLASRLPPRADGSRRDIRDLEPLMGGATSDIRAFWADDVRLVLRRSLPVRVGPSIGTQAAAMRAAHAVGVPVPEVYAAADADPELGAFMVMELIEGETIPRRIQRDELLADARARFAADTGAALARLHAADVAVVPDLDRRDLLDRYRQQLDDLGAPSATFEWAFRYLDANRPPLSPPVLVHGDFRLGNLMVGPEGVRSVLDWEDVHAGDPIADLGWLCTKTWRFGQRAPVGGFGTREELLAAYHEGGGAVVPIEVLRWWELFGSLKWGIICMVQASRHFAGTPSVELAAIGRRVAEVEWDLLGLLP
jgi:aminoglycoside phosphotransferase (APT) family kinase protein